MTDVTVTQAAKEEAQKVRWDQGIPVRVVERDGVAIWSKVDDDMQDLTLENSEGLLYHVRSLFVPHGADNPLYRTAHSGEGRSNGAGEDADRALKWINHNLMLAKGLMKSSSEAGNGAENFRAHEAHHALSVAKGALTAPPASDAGEVERERLVALWHDTIVGNVISLPTLLGMTEGEYSVWASRGPAALSQSEGAK